MRKSRELKVRYDEKRDILNVMIGEHTEGFLVEMEDGFFVKLSAETGDVIGYTILNYSRNVHKNKHWCDRLLTKLDRNWEGSFYGTMNHRHPKAA